MGVWPTKSIKQDLALLRAENSRLREALDRIARPIWWLQEDQKQKTGSINGVNGAMALSLSESPEYLKGIAKKALISTTNKNKE